MVHEQYCFHVQYLFQSKSLSRSLSHVGLTTDAPRTPRHASLTSYRDGELHVFNAPEVK